MAKSSFKSNNNICNFDNDNDNDESFINNNNGLFENRDEGDDDEENKEYCIPECLNHRKYQKGDDMIGCDGIVVIYVQDVLIGIILDVWV